MYSIDNPFVSPQRFFEPFKDGSSNPGQKSTCPELFDKDKAIFHINIEEGGCALPYNNTHTQARCLLQESHLS